METFLFYLSVALVGAMFLPFYRIMAGPTLFDRMLGVAAIGNNALILVCVLGFVFRRQDMFVDIAIAYAMLNFIGLIAVSMYFQSPPKKD